MAAEKDENSKYGCRNRTEKKRKIGRLCGKHAFKKL